MKKLLSLLLVAVFVLSLTVCGLGTVAAARPTTTTRSSGPEFPIFSVDRAAAMAGDTFTVPVRVEANPGIVSLKLALEYDADVLELVESAEQDFAGVSYGPTEKVPFIINWVDTIHPDNRTNGIITNLTFRVKEGTPVGHHLLSLSYDPEDVYNAAWDGVAFATQDAYVSVVDFRMGDVDDDGRINNRDLGLLLQYVNSWDVLIHDYAADVTGDGRINNRDLGLLQQYVNGWDVVPEYPEMIKAPEPDMPATTSTSVIAPTTTKTQFPTGDDDVLENVPDSLNGQKIKMLTWWNTSDGERAKADYFKERTGIQVAYEVVPMSDYLSTLSAKVMANNAPATAAIINEWYPLPITRGLMQPIKNTGWDYSNKDDDIYSISLMDQFSYKGEHYGVALKSSAMLNYEMMFYNKDLLAQYGVTETPYELWKEGRWNWDTCLTIAQQCTDAKNGKYGLTNISQFYWMLSAGQDFVLSDINGLKNNIKSSDLLNTWIHAWDMINTHKVIPTNFSQQKELFYNEQVAMFGAGSYFMMADANYTGYVPQNCDFDWGVVPFPSPKGKSAVAACEGTVWGFPTKVSGNKLQAAMWWLRFYLDDAHYDRDLLANEQCWEVLQWMSEQKIQSYNSVGVISYGGKYNAWSIPYSVIDEATTKAAIQTNLHSWHAEIEQNISVIESELG